MTVEIVEEALLDAQRTTTTAGQTGNLRSAPVPLAVLRAAITAYLSALRPGSTGEDEGCGPISDEPLEALAHARTTASNDDPSKPGTVERERHCQRIAAMQAASKEIKKLRAMLAAAGGEASHG